MIGALHGVEAGHPASYSGTAEPGDGIDLFLSRQARRHTVGGAAHALIEAERSLALQPGGFEAPCSDATRRGRP